ncbi:TIM-barrel domain-containing protein [Pinibacter soli]|uniref:Glycoside hydrolase family 31 protein n=1 Tax=Pinibacter soli TaxID=3044211 RepID=A0ABT6RAH8_9BACT|nr:TIM-barrel domain-containing protein [Pinibacter soli]MDI3319410.1 glycoside hydrolase family 31 protein [Pinibacter soli]
MQTRRIKFTLSFALVLLLATAKAQTYTRISNGVSINTKGITTEITFFNNGIVHVKKYPVGNVAETKSFSVIGKPGKPTVAIIEGKDGLQIKSKNIAVIMSMPSGQIKFGNNEGHLYLQENSTSFSPVKDGNENTFRIKQSFKLERDEAIYGFGQFQNGHMSQRNQQLLLKQENMRIAIPFFQSIKNYGVFWDNASATVFSDSNNVASLQSEIGNCIDYYFIKGANADSVIEQYQLLTGEVPMFPKWVFGYWQSRERYTSQHELLDVVNRYRALKVPLDGIVQDWQYWGEDQADWNAVRFGNPRFPDPKKMIDSVHNMNAHIIISVWPSFGYKTKIYKELEAKNMLFNFQTWPPKDVKVYDAFNPEARDIYWSHMKNDIFSLGMDGWWLDATEPEKAGPDLVIDAQSTYAGSFQKVGNAFPIATTGGVSDHQKQLTKDKRVFILTRSAFAGQQRYATMLWSGDIQGKWDVLRAQIAAGCNLSLSGIPYWNTDVGGFFTGNNYPLGVKDPAYKELYVRWFQFATFCPMLRSHGTNTPREIYQLGNRGEWAFDAVEKYINLRYQLLPYIYSCAWQVTSQHLTMTRALAMDFASDKNVWDVNNQYMFGKSLLVCPVTDSLYTSRAGGVAETNFSNVKTTSVYLPSGADWFDFWTGEKMKGGQQVSKQVPIDIIPVFVKSGTILPVAASKQFALEHADSTLEIRVYEGANGEFILYEDEGDNYNYEKGVYATISFKWNNAKYQLEISDRKGKFPGMLQTRNFNIKLVGKDEGKVVKYNGKKVVVPFN